MATRLDQRVRRLRLRKNDLIKGVKTKSVRLSNSESRFDSAADAVDYISESMLPVDQEYTDLTFEECRRIETHIKEACTTSGHPIEFRHQGSVTTNTHIKFYSDIDLLVLTDKHYACQAPVVPTSPYQGDGLADLKEIRSIVETRLETSFPKAKVDKTGKKAVAISGGSLSRKIDVLSASWLDTEQYRRTLSEQDRGVKILDLDGPKRISNFPFIHNRELNNKDSVTGGALKKLIRFVKSARYDADTAIGVSSYDIASLCYHLPIESFRKAIGNDYSLAHEFLEFADKLRLDSTLQQNLYVPNKTRLIFGEGGVNVDQLKLLNEEMLLVLQQAQQSRGLFS